MSEAEMQKDSLMWWWWWRKVSCSALWPMVCKESWLRRSRSQRGWQCLFGEGRTRKSSARALILTRDSIFLALCQKKNFTPFLDTTPRHCCLRITCLSREKRPHLRRAGGNSREGLQVQSCQTESETLGPAVKCNWVFEAGVFVQSMQSTMILRTPARRHPGSTNCKLSASHQRYEKSKI